MQLLLKFGIGKGKGNFLNFEIWRNQFPILSIFLANFWSTWRRKTFLCRNHFNWGILWFSIKKNYAQKLEKFLDVIAKMTLSTLTQFFKPSLVNQLSCQFLN